MILSKSVTSEVGAGAEFKVGVKVGAGFKAGAGVKVGVKVSTSVAIAVVIAISVRGAASAAESQNDCIFLDQSQSTAGSYKTTLTTNAIKMERSGSKLFLIARAPTWRVVFYNPKNNRAIDLPYDQWLLHRECWTSFLPPAISAHGNTIGGASKVGSVGDGGLRKISSEAKKAINDIPGTDVVIQDYDGSRLELMGTVIYCGQNCSRYGMLDTQLRGTVDPKHRYKAEIYVCKASGIPTQALQILQKMYLIPPVDGIPVFSTKLEIATARHEHAGDPRGVLNLFEQQGRLSTRSFTRGHASDADLNYPKNFQKVFKETDVMLDSSAQKAGNDMSELFGADIDDYKTGHKRP